MEDKETLRVGVASKLIVKVYDIALGRREVPASFEQLGVIRFDLDYPPRWEWSLSFLGERLFLRSSSRVLAWSFVTGRYVWGPGKDLHLSKSICTANTYIGFNDEAIFTWYISSWDANAQPVPSTPLPYTLDQTQPRIDRSPDWWISLDYDELQRDGEIRFVLPEGTSSHNTKLPILLDMFFVSGPFAIGYELPTIAYRYSLDVVVERDEAVQEVKFEQKAYWMFPSKAFEFFPRPFQGPLQHGYSSTTLVRNYLDRGTPRRTVDAIYSLVRIPPNPEDEDTADEGPPVGDAHGSAKQPLTTLTKLTPSYVTQSVIVTSLNNTQPWIRRLLRMTTALGSFRWNCGSKLHLHWSLMTFYAWNSRAMREMISTRDVWISVLRSTSRKNALFMPSFPVDEMELQEIKRAALGAYRWKRMTAGEMNHLTPKSTTSIGEEYNPFIRQFLVPGGRFLFVINRGILVLWDLGPPGRPPLTSPLMIASVKLEAQPRKRTRITVTSSGSDRLRVAVLSENGVNASMDSVDVVKIYDVCPVADEPAFIELGSLELLGAPPPEEALESSWEFRLRMHNDRLLIQVCGTLIVWDFAEGTYTSWCTAHKDSPKTHLPPVIFTGDMVLGFVSTKVVGWSVPHLTNSVPERIRLARVCP
ncbi:hypothetical protein MD484_g8052, partial [Candolleomyces efflorescens]